MDNQILDVVRQLYHALFVEVVVDQSPSQESFQSG